MVTAVAWKRTGAAALIAVAVAAAGSVARAQTPLTLEDAMKRARSATPEARASASAVGEADERVRQARSGYLPRVDVSESVQRGNQPVFVFSSLLSQRQFTAANFAIGSLNEPSPLTNTRTAIAVEQRLYDAGLTRLGVQAAELGREVAAAERIRAAQDLALRAARAFLAVLQLEATSRANDAAVAAAESDLQRARARRESGLVTEADVLSVQVHLADMRQRQIAVSGDLSVARIQLAEALGLPLGESLVLARPAAPSDGAADLASDAWASRPERRQAELRERLADNARRTAQAGFLPSVGLMGGWELNGATFGEQRSAWTIGAQIQINLFRGFADSARLAESRHAAERAAAERERIDRSIELEVRSAVARLAAARARHDTGRAALEQARESQRIIRDRYDSGLATVTDVLRAAEAALDAESRATAAEMDVIFQGVALQRALGRL